ncbi:GNAT family N-acetyltransferase [Natribacillus halophilus]|uniref:Acetyltransferase (GNAT) family protein n=1 Tax=Natribacillus halophilus TaxID=549003 RepID=A0A1G8RYR6_9BACI|nr:GNAT family N-acetyltransferase [Natribacillus halophilus]SDJ22144.1 Acetyltransferase (GNAT) family protein [Natribacillus halophilus]
MPVERIDYEEAKKAMTTHLQADTEAKRPAFASREKTLVCFVIKDEGEIVAGINGEIFWHNMHISLFSVHASYRGRGCGSQLLQKMEAEAVNHSCRMMYLETLSWQAPDFYKKHGFEIVGKLDGYPIAGECQYYMRKLLV